MGDLSIYYYEEMMSAVILKMKEEGYKIERQWEQRGV